MQFLKQDEVKAGDTIYLTGSRGITNHLTHNKAYKALYGGEEGIFAGSPYVTVIGDNGEKYSCHLSRFSKTPL